MLLASFIFWSSLKKKNKGQPHQFQPSNRQCLLLGFSQNKYIAQEIPDSKQLFLLALHGKKGKFEACVTMGIRTITLRCQNLIPGKAGGFLMKPGRLGGGIACCLYSFQGSFIHYKAANLGRKGLVKKELVGCRG